MNRIGLHDIILVFALSAYGWADAPITVELKPGMNEIAVAVNNQSGIDLKSASIEIKDGSLIEGISVDSDHQHLDVRANSLSKESIVLQIQVDSQIKAGTYPIRLTLKDGSDFSMDFTLNFTVSTGPPVQYDLLQNYPNPFNADTEIGYSVAPDKEQETRLIVHDGLGRVVRSLVNKKQFPGAYRIIWDGKDNSGNEVASGMYFYRLTSGSFVKLNKMILLK